MHTLCSWHKLAKWNHLWKHFQSTSVHACFKLLVVNNLWYQLLNPTRISAFSKRWCIWASVKETLRQSLLTLLVYGWSMCVANCTYAALQLISFSDAENDVMTTPFPCVSTARCVRVLLKMFASHRNLPCVVMSSCLRTHTTSSRELSMLLQTAIERLLEVLVHVARFFFSERWFENSRFQPLMCVLKCCDQY